MFSFRAKVNMFKHKNILLFLLLAHLTACISEGTKKCVSLKRNSQEATSELNIDFQVDYTCPREFDPKSFTECCHNGGCCETSILSMAPTDDWLLMITGILVISSCMILTILVVICCFWSKCPLYNACRANYNTSNVIVYSLSKDDPTPLMPAEAHKNGHYHPCTVKIKKMQEV